MNKDFFCDASSDDQLWKCSQGFIITLKSSFLVFCECVVMSQEILKNEEAMYLQMIEQPSELEGQQQGRQETERWKLGNVFIFVR
ncbi:unnamed protein product [Sphagnum compactum]